MRTRCITASARAARRASRSGGKKLPVFFVEQAGQLHPFFTTIVLPEGKMRAVMRGSSDLLHCGGADEVAPARGLCR
jgi:hypothetical protein